MSVCRISAGRRAPVWAIVICLLFAGSLPGAPAQFSYKPLETLYKQSEKGFLESARILGREYMRRGAFPQAVEQFEKLMDNAPFDSRVVSSMTQCLVGMNGLDHGPAQYSDKRNKNDAWRALFIQAALVSGRKTEAARLTEELAARDIPPAVLEFVASSARQCLPFAKARPVFERLVGIEAAKLAPYHSPFVSLAELLYNNGSREEAILTLSSYLNKFEVFVNFEYPATRHFPSSGFLLVLRKMAKMLKDRREIPADYSAPECECLLRRALLFHLCHNNAEAEKSFNHLFSTIKGAGPFVHMTLAVILRQLDRLEMSRTQIVAALDEAPGPDDNARLAAIYRNSNNGSQRKSLFRGSLYGELADVCLSAGRSSEALEASRRALLEDPGEPRAAAVMENFINHPVLATSANKALREAASIYGAPALLVMLAKSEIHLGNFAAAYEAAGSAVDKAPLSLSALKTYVRICTALGRGNEALTRSAWFVEKGGGPGGLDLITETAIRFGLTRRARELLAPLLRKSIEPFDLIVAAYAALCDTDTLRRRFAETCSGLVEKTGNTKRKRAFRLAAANLLFLLGEDKKASACADGIEKSLELGHPSFPILRNICLKAGRGRLLADELSIRGMSMEGKRAMPYHREAARICGVMGNRALAMVHYARALGIAPGDKSLEHEFMNFGMKTVGFPYFVQGLLEKTTGHFQFYRFLGSYYLQRGHRRNAKAFLKLAQAYRPQNPDLKILYGKSLLLARREEEGIALLEEGLGELGWPADRNGLLLERQLLCRDDNNKLLKLLKNWIKKRHSPLADAKAAVLAGCCSFTNELKSFYRKREATDPFNPGLTLARAGLETTKRSSIIKAALLRCLDVQASFSEDSQTLRLCKAYTDLVSSRKEAEEGLKLMERAIELNQDSLELHRLREKLLEKADRAREIPRVIEDSLRYFPSDSPLMFDRLTDLVASLERIGRLDEYIALIDAPPTTSIDSEECKRRLFTVWLGLSKLNRPKEAAMRKNRLLSMLHGAGRSALAALERLEAWNEVESTLIQLSQREGANDVPSIMLKRADILANHLASGETAAGVLKKLVERWPETEWAARARLRLLRMGLDGTIDIKSLTGLLALEPPSSPPDALSPGERCIRGRAAMALGMWKTAREIMDNLSNSITVLSDSDSSQVLALLEAGLAADSPKTQAWRASLGRLALSLNSRIPRPPCTDRLTAIAKMQEMAHLMWLDKIIGKKNGTGSAVRKFLSGLQFYDEKHYIQALGPLYQVAQQSPPVRDLYGSPLALSVRLLLCRCLAALGCNEKARRTAEYIISQSSGQDIDDAGSSFRRAQEFLVELKLRGNPGNNNELSEIVSILEESDRTKMLSRARAILERADRFSADVLGRLGDTLCASRPCREAARAYLAAADSGQASTDTATRLRMKALEIYLEPRWGCLDMKLAEHMLKALENEKNIDTVKMKNMRARLDVLRARAFRNRRKYAKAIPYFHKAGLYFDEGICWQYLQKWVRALECFDRHLCRNRNQALSNEQTKRVIRTISSYLDEGPERELKFTSKELNRLFRQELALRFF